jgi:hypothetical protein
MELYKSLAQKCNIEENSRVYVSDEALRMFVRLIISDPSEEKFAVFGYTSGLFDGTGGVDYHSVKQFHEEVSKEVKKLESEDKMFGIYEHFGVDIKYVHKENFERKSKVKP